MKAPDSIEAVHIQQDDQAKGDLLFEKQTARLDNLAEQIDPNAVGGNLSDMPKGYYRSAAFIGTLSAVCLGNACHYLGFVVPASIISVINADIGPNPAYTWISLVWVLTVAVTYSILGRLSDIMGRRWFFLGGNILGLVGNIVVGTAHSIPVAIGGTTLIGIAGAVQLSFPLILGELVPNKHRAHANMAAYIVGLPFSAFGPVIARAFILQTKLGWRWPYFVSAILSVFAVVLLFFCYHPPTLGMIHSKGGRKSAIHLVDIGGVVLYSSGLFLLLLGLSWGGGQYAWKSGQVIGTIVGGGVIIMAFGFYEAYVPLSYPLVLVRLWTKLPYVATIMTASIGATVYYSMSILWPMQVTALYAAGTSHAGWLSCVAGAGTSLGNLIGCVTCGSLGHQKWQMVVSAVGMTVFMGAMAASDQGTVGLAVAFMVLGAMFVGIMEAVAFVTAQLCLEPEDIGLASGTMGTVRSALSTIATTIYLAILNNKKAAYITKHVDEVASQNGVTDAQLAKILAGFASGNINAAGVSQPVLDMLQDVYKTSYSQSLHVVYLASISFGAIAIIFAFYSPNLETKFNDEVSRRLHGSDLTKKERATTEAVEALGRV
ncbi:hypothetical protein Sste5346_008833 [Sporothrix stenoceras]|uniref:Major facilitator superfamily (MFS) profile domain-containing protein n=1 Tax=Sporothrix stenoceras TaxID=5173 RepID=A0ABR3YML6_9PEZI